MFNFFKRTPRTKAQEISSEYFYELVENKKDAIVVLMAPWCESCRMQKPLIDDLAHTHREKSLRIHLLNSDHSPRVMREYIINAVPTLIVLQRGEIVFRHSGVMPRRELEKVINLIHG